MPSLNLAAPETAAPLRPSRHSAPSSASAADSPKTALKRKPSAGILTTTTTPSGRRTTRITTTASSAAATTTAPPTSDRYPLRIRDQNVVSTRRPLNPALGPRLAPLNTRMPYEKPHPVTTRPAAMSTVARGINKPPLTPKVASRTATPQHQNLPIATPLARRGGPRPDLVLSSNGTVPREKEEVASPVSAFLSSNITPRSGSRQIRVDSANSTPTGTPNLERHDSWESRSGLAVPASTTDDGQRRPLITSGSPMETSSGTRQDPDSKFFYASDAQKLSHPMAQVRPAPTLQKPATFFYANGESVQPRENALHPSFTPVPAMSPPPQEASSKFVYANGIPDLTPPTKSGASHPAAPSSVVSTQSRIPTTRPSTAVSQTAFSPRPSSPVKLAPYSPAPSAGNTNPSLRPPMSTANPQGGQASQRTGRPARGHTRAGSLTSNLTIAEPPAVARILSAHSALPSPQSSSPDNGIPPVPSITPSNPVAVGFPSLLQPAEDFAEEDEAKSESLHSPTKSASQEKQLTDLVASARRERKVQDLEITNASLEAINRTLERQLRKQTAELRRYRRLSRSGRLSLASVGNRIPSDSTVDGGALARAGMDLDDLSEEESDAEAQDEELDDEDDFSSSEASGELDPTAVKLRDARHRQRDERRLQLDLSKHQQLLIDSQKINQSLKRCLGWTEELIKEGKRALEYRVRVSEVEIGGRVLAPEDIEAREARDAQAARELAAADRDDGDGDDRGNRDLALRGTNPRIDMRLASDMDTQPWSKDPQDRDSGIELPTDGG